MKKSQLRQIIREEISKIIEAETAPTQPAVKQTAASTASTFTSKSSTSSTPQKQSAEVIALIKYLNTTGKTALKNISTRKELNDILTAIWNGMHDTMKKDSNAKSVYNIISQKIK
jgi:BRCT domain type II-containing protein